MMKLVGFISDFTCFLREKMVSHEFSPLHFDIFWDYNSLLSIK